MKSSGCRGTRTPVPLPEPTLHVMMQASAYSRALARLGWGFLFAGWQDPSGEERFLNCQPEARSTPAIGWGFLFAPTTPRSIRAIILLGQVTAERRDDAYGVGFSS
jgi:hypothetical protein